MADKIRDLEISSLSEEQIDALTIAELRRLKPISNKDYNNLPEETKQKLSVLYDQSMVVWNDANKMRDLSYAEIVELLEPYKTRSFKTFPQFLTENMKNLYLAGAHNPKTTRLLLWFLDKRDFDSTKLPDEINQFLDSAFANTIDDYDDESFRTLVGGIRKFRFVDLTETQKAFMRTAFAKDIDTMTNDQLYVLVNYVKNATALGTDFARMPTIMQQFVLGCYKRCVVKTETSANNKKMTGAWHMSNEDQYRCFAAFNRAFVGLSKIDRAMYFDKPAKKLNLPNLINYTNFQSEYIGNGSINNFCGDVYSRAKAIADEMNLPIIYNIYDNAYHFDASVLLPYTKIDAYYLDEREGILFSEQIDQYGNPQRVYNVETEREYKERVATPLSKTFESMVEYYVRIATKDVLSDTISPEEQEKACSYLISIFDGELTNRCEAMIEHIATEYEFKKPVFVQKATETMNSLMNVDAMKENFARKSKAKEKWQSDLAEYLESLSPEELEDWRMDENRTRAEINVYKVVFAANNNHQNQYFDRSYYDDSYDPTDINTWSKSDIAYRIGQIGDILRKGNGLDERRISALTFELQELQYLLYSDKFEEDSDEDEPERD